MSTTTRTSVQVRLRSDQASCKVVVRGLPPTLPLSVWTRVLEPFAHTIDWSSFVPGESVVSSSAGFASGKEPVPALAHLHLSSRAAVESLINALNGHVFRDSSRRPLSLFGYLFDNSRVKETEYPIGITVAPFQRVPRPCDPDRRCNTLAEDPDYIAFLALLEDPEKKADPLSALRPVVTSSSSETVVPSFDPSDTSSTPLLRAIKAKAEEKLLRKKDNGNGVSGSGAGGGRRRSLYEPTEKSIQKDAQQRSKSSKKISKEERQRLRREERARPENQEMRRKRKQEREIRRREEKATLKAERKAASAAKNNGSETKRDSATTKAPPTVKSGLTFTLSTRGGTTSVSSIASSSKMEVPPPSVPQDTKKSNRNRNKNKKKGGAYSSQDTSAASSSNPVAKQQPGPKTSEKPIVILRRRNE